MNQKHSNVSVEITVFMLVLKAMGSACERLAEIAAKEAQLLNLVRANAKEHEAKMKALAAMKQAAAEDAEKMSVIMVTLVKDANVT